MKRKSLLLIMLFFSISCILTISCEKNAPVEEGEKLSALDIELAKDDAIADDIYDDIDGVVQEKLMELSENNYQDLTTKSTEEDYTCLIVTVDYPDSTRFPKVVTFDYGEGCQVIFNGDTIFKEGKIIVTLTDKFDVPGSQHIMTFDEFYINGIKVEGTRTITYQGLNDSGLLLFEISLENGKLTFQDPATGELLTYTREALLTKEWLRTHIPFEDTVYMNGSLWGVNVYGENYSREIIEPLTLVHCPEYGRRWVIVDGQVLSKVGEIETIIDYEDGGCDGTALVRREEARHTIRIREQNRIRTGGRK